MKSLQAKNFSLKHTVECGQFFRYEQLDDYYHLSHQDKLFKVKQQGNHIYFKNATHSFIRNFFRLDDDYKKIIKSISQDKHINEAVNTLFGLRIIRQDPWECLISYICSSNSNIPKIKTNLKLISEKFGKKISLDGYDTYTFPKPGELSSKTKLKACKVGYRAKFIYEVNKNITKSKLNALKTKNYALAKTQLIRLYGVGDKIADCVLLFSLERLNAFPVDVWVQRAMQEIYFKNKSVIKTHIREFGQNYFGEYAGYANQFLFYHRRQK